MNKLKEYCLNITDGEHGSIPDVADSEYYFLNNNNITDNGIVINPTDRKISKTDFDRIHKRTQLSIGDVVIASCGTIGKTQVIKDTDIKYDFSRSVGIIKCDTSKLLPEFLHFYFKNPETQKRIMRASEGAVQKHFYIGAMENFDVDIPDLNEQQRIVQCLSAIDSKVTNNSSICSTLESMTKLLYDYWFVQFDFPDENGRPYKSSGGKMVWNEELKREIPEGWEVKLIRELLGSYPKTTSVIRDDYAKGNKYPIIDQSKDFICGYTDDNDKVLHMDDAIVFGDHTNVAKYVNFDFARGADGTQIINSNDDRLPNYILYMQISSLPIIEEGYSRHYKFLKEQNVIIPAKKVSTSFMAKTSPTLVRRRHFIEENRQLASLRDFLLPMLMNGQVKVGKGI